jgi:RNA polymerase sigma factor for flagellar operon FliA
VTRAAKKLMRGLPAQVELDELVSAGSFGLLAAMERFDRGRQVKFETFSQPSIRGAMLDYLREVDHLSRGSRTSANRLIEATERLRMKLGRPPCEEELRKQLDVSRDKLRRMMRASQAGANLSIEHRARGNDDGGRPHIDVLAAGPDDAPLRGAMKHDVKEWVVQGLSRRNRLIIVLYYYENMTMREIGEVLSMSESRVSQLRSEIIESLQERLPRREDELMLDVA